MKFQEILKAPHFFFYYFFFYYFLIFYVHILHVHVYLLWLPNFNARLVLAVFCCAFFENSRIND